MKQRAKMFQVRQKYSSPNQEDKWEYKLAPILYEHMITITTATHICQKVFKGKQSSILPDVIMLHDVDLMEHCVLGDTGNIVLHLHSDVTW